MINKDLEKKINDAFSEFNSLTKLYDSLQRTHPHYRKTRGRTFKESHTPNGELISLQSTRKHRVFEIRKDDDNYFRITKNLKGQTTYEIEGDYYSEMSDYLIKVTLT